MGGGKRLKRKAAAEAAGAPEPSRRVLRSQVKTEGEDVSVINAVADFMAGRENLASGTGNHASGGEDEGGAEEGEIISEYDSPEEVDSEEERSRSKSKPDSRERRARSESRRHKKKKHKRGTRRRERAPARKSPPPVSRVPPEVLSALGSPPGSSQSGQESRDRRPTEGEGDGPPKASSSTMSQEPSSAGAAVGEDSEMVRARQSLPKLRVDPRGVLIGWNDVMDQLKRLTSGLADLSSVGGTGEPQQQLRRLQEQLVNTLQLLTHATTGSGEITANYLLLLGQLELRDERLINLEGQLILERGDAQKA